MIEHNNIILQVRIIYFDVASECRIVVDFSDTTSDLKRSAERCPNADIFYKDLRVEYVHYDYDGWPAFRPTQHTARWAQSQKNKER